MARLEAPAAADDEDALPPALEDAVQQLASASEILATD